jgi:hypothetical protein
MRFTDDEGRFTYLAEIELGEGQPIQILPLGKKTHPEFGSIDITPEKCQNFVKNFEAKVRGIDTPLNYAHGNDLSKGQKAAGWIKSLEFRPDSGLWAVPNYTSEAEKEVNDKAWRYISAEYRDSWKDGNGKTHNDVLFGAALTNKPFMKDMAPINFEDFDPVELGVGSTMYMSPTAMQAHLASAHGKSVAIEPHSNLYSTHESQTHGPTTHEHTDRYLTDEDPAIFLSVSSAERTKAKEAGDAFPDGSYPITNQEQANNAWKLRNNSKNHSEASVVAHIRAMVKKHGLTMPGTSKMDDRREVNVDLKVLAEKVGLKEEDGEEKILGRVDKLSEFYLANKPEDKKKTFAEEYPEEAERTAKLQRELDETKADSKIKEWNGKGLPPKINASVKAFMLGDKTIKLTEDNKEVEKPVSFEGIVETIVTTGLVPLKNGNNESKIDLSDPQAQWKAEVEKKMAENDKLTTREARKAVAHDNPELAELILKGTKETG